MKRYLLQKICVYCIQRKVNSLYFLAELYIDLDKEDEAIEVLHDIPENDDLYVQSLLLVADLFQMQGFDDVAEQKLLKAKEMMPDEPVITFGLAELYSSKGEEQKGNHLL